MTHKEMKEMASALGVNVMDLDSWQDFLDLMVNHRQKAAALEEIAPTYVRLRDAGVI